MFGETDSILSIQNQIIRRVTLAAPVEETTLNHATRKLSILVRKAAENAAGELGLSRADSLSGVDFEGRVSGIHVELSEMSSARVMHPMT